MLGGGGFTSSATQPRLTGDRAGEARTWRDWRLPPAHPNFKNARLSCGSAADKDDSLEDADELPEPQDLAAETITELEAVGDDLREIVALVEKEEGLTTDYADDTDEEQKVETSCFDAGTGRRGGRSPAVLRGSGHRTRPTAGS